MPMTEDEAARDCCRESCAAFGDPPCWRFDYEAGVEFKLCEECRVTLGIATPEQIDPGAVVAPLL